MQCADIGRVRKSSELKILYCNQETNVDRVTNKGYNSRNDKFVLGERLEREIL